MSTSEGLNSNEKDAAFLHKDLKGESQKTTTGIHHLSDWSASHDLYHGKINDQHHATSVKRFKGNTGPNSLHKTGFQGRSHHDIVKSAVKRDNPHLSSAEAHSVATQIHNSHPTVKEDLDLDPQSMNNRRLGAIARNPNHPMHTHAKAELDRRKVKRKEMGEGAMKRIATTQASKTDRVASTDKKGLETFKKKPTSEAKDPGEYDNEGAMAKTQLKGILTDVEHMIKMFSDDQNLPEWVQNKITKAADYLNTAHRYMMNDDDAQTNEAVVQRLLHKGATVKGKFGGKVTSGKVVDHEIVQNKAGVVVHWKSGEKGRFPNDHFDTKGHHKSMKEQVELQESTPAYHTGSIEDRSEAHHDQASHHFNQAEKHAKNGDKMAASVHRSAARSHARAGMHFEKHIGKDPRVVPQGPSRKAHAYTQKANSYNESVEKMEEKTLTPAEIRKRDKIAKAIKKDDPDIPMDKKMAIATATAKRVAEGKVDEVLDTPQARKSYRDKRDASYDRAAKSMRAKILGDKPQPHSDDLRTINKREKGLKMLDKKTGTKPKSRWAMEGVAEGKDDEYHKTLGQTKNSDEGIAALKKKHGMSHTKAVATLKRLMGEQKVDEISSNKLGDYIKKSAADVSKSRGDARRQDKRIGGQKMADDKIRKKMGYSSQAKVPAGTNEGSEQKVDELKKSTLASYIKKASDDRAKNAYDIGKSGKINYKGLKRRQGINRAVNKMANEENIDEVLDTPKAMQSYKDKAKYSKDRAANSAAAKILRGPDADGNRADHSPELKTMAKRRSGEKMVDRLAGRKTFKALRGNK